MRGDMPEHDHEARMRVRLWPNTTEALERLQAAKGRSANRLINEAVLALAASNMESTPDVCRPESRPTE